MIYVVIYIIGFIISLLVWSMFGKKFWGIDYDDNDDDDWNGNRNAYTAFSLAWPIFFIVGSLALIWKVLTAITDFLIKLFNNDNRRSIENVEENTTE